MELAGKRYGHLTVKEFVERKNYRNYWLCECDCGNTVTLPDYILKADRQHYCSKHCLLINDLTGRKFGRLTVIELATKKPRKWKCICECGNYTIVSTSDLCSGHTKSCGCYKLSEFKKHREKHLKCRTKLYAIWCGIRQRCNNPNNKDYKNYGGRGIKCCSQWDKYENFYEWAINNEYKSGLSIERIDVNKDYEPNNCKFIELRKQSENTRKTVKFTINNETKTLKEWCSLYNKSLSIVKRRLELGWSIQEALIIPKIRGKSKKAFLSKEMLL